MLAAKVDGQEQHLILGSRHGRRILKVSVLCHLLLICFPLFKSPISLKESVPRCLAVVGPDKVGYITLSYFLFGTQWIWKKEKHEQEIENAP